jgi:hypothetical protein
MCSTHPKYSCPEGARPRRIEDRRFLSLHQITRVNGRQPDIRTSLASRTGWPGGRGPRSGRVATAGLNSMARLFRRTGGKSKRSRDNQWQDRRGIAPTASDGSQLRPAPSSLVAVQISHDLPLVVRQLRLDDVRDIRCVPACLGRLFSTNYRYIHARTL